MQGMNPNYALAGKAVMVTGAARGIYLFLASSDARPIIGQAIVVSNGEVMH